MRRGALVLAGLVPLLILAGSLPAAAYVDRGYDPRDQNGWPYDIRSTVRRVERGTRGRYLDVKVKVYGEGLSPGTWALGIEVRLDAKGGRAYDSRLSMWVSDMEGHGCGLATRGGKDLGKGRLRFPNASSIACRVLAHPLHPTKAIRWNVTLAKYDIDPGSDTAPDDGMYR